MFGHFPELIIVLVLALVFFGPEKLPEIANSAGKMVGELRNAMHAVTEGDREIKDDEFDTYYYEAMQRQADDEAYLDELPDPADDTVEYPEVDGVEHVHNGAYSPQHDEAQVVGEGASLVRPPSPPTPEAVRPDGPESA